MKPKIKVLVERGLLAICSAALMFMLGSCGTGGGTEPVVNNPPNSPTNPVPSDGAVDQPIDATLSWTCTDPENDALTYDVFFGVTSSPGQVASDSTQASYDPGPLQYFRIYYWKIRARDSQGNTKTGSVWSFTTELSDSSAPPYVPSNPDPADGATNVSYSVTLSWVGGDPNGDPVTYDVYFGVAPDPPLMQSDHAAESYPISGLSGGTTYHWKIVAHDNQNNSTSGPIWSFTTLPLSSSQIVSYGALPRWSPDGQKLAFGGEGISAGLWIYDRSDGSVTQITDNSYPHLWDYRWSSDSDQIAFGGAGATIDSTSGIYTVALDGSDPVRWHATGHSPDWTPNGSGLVFAEEDAQGGTYGLFKLLFADTSLTRLTFSGTDPQYNPSGTQIAFRDPGAALPVPLKVMLASGLSATTVADTCLQFDWTADGSNLVYDYMSYDLNDSGLRICMVPATGGTKVKIAAGATQPSVATTGRIAYQGVISDLSLGIWVINLDASDNRQLTGSGFQPSVTPDGTLIAYARSDGIWLVTP